MGKVLAALVPTAPPPVAETLLLAEISNAYGHITIRTVWATSTDLRGPRRSDIESTPTQAALQLRLAELGRDMLAGYPPAAAARSPS